MKKFLIIISILVFSNLLVYSQTGKPDFKVRSAPLAGQKVNIIIDTLAKNYIAAYMERNEGRFTIKAREGNRNLLYGGILAGGAVYTSHANFKIDDQLFTMRPSLYGAQKVNPRKFDNDNNKLSVTFYECDGVEIRQELIPRENITKKAGAVLIKYVFKNNSSSPKRVGAALKLDTYIGGFDNITGNDSARLSTPIGIIRNQQEINPITDYWLAFQDIQDTSALIGRGTLRGRDLVFPDFMFVGNYEELTQYKYDEPIQSGGPYYDSEILMRWNQKLLAPGDSLYYSTLYGMGEIDYQGNTLSLYCSAPFDTLTMDANSNYELNPFDYLVSVRNPGLTIDNVKATIKLNNNTFFLQNPADSVRYLGQLAGGEQKLATWKISTKNQCSSKEENIKVVVTGESSDTNFCITSIYVPANKLFSLNLSVDPVGGGLAEKFPNRTKYECNVPVTITATPNTGYKFIGWGGDYVGLENPKTFYLDSTKNIIARFLVDSFNLDVRVSPVGAGKIKMSGKLVDDGIYRFKNGSSVELSYIPDSCYQFTGWSGDTTLPANVSLFTVNMWKNKSITANFVRRTYKIRGGDVVGSGNIEMTKYTVNDTAFYCDDKVSLKAIPTNCFDFDKWYYVRIGIDSGYTTENPIAFNIRSDIKGTAYFKIKKFSLTTSIEPPGSGVISRSLDKTEYDCGDVVKLTVTPDKCFNFVKWEDDDINNPRTITMNQGSVTHKAILERKKYTVFATLDYLNGGSITKTPAKDTLYCGDTVKVSLTQNCPYSFVKWSDGLGTRTRTVYVDANKVFIANMAKIAFDVTKAEPNIFPNIVVDLRVDSILFSQNPILVPALNRTQFSIIDEDTVPVRKSITNFNLLQSGIGYQIVYSLYGNCFDKSTDLNRKAIVNFSYNGCTFADTARYKINLNAGCDSCSRMLKKKTQNALFANRPNPFNPETRIRYSIANNERVSLVVYDVLGREVATLVDEYKDAGEYEVTFMPKGLPSGVYLYRIKTGSFQDVKKMVFLK